MMTRLNKKVILESNLDFKQFQNLFILTFCATLILFGSLSSVQFKTYNFFHVSLIFLNVFFLAILFTRKGLYLENRRLYVCIFLFGLVLKQTLIKTKGYQQIQLQKGKLSTNYAYTYDVREFRNWEPNLNHSVECFTICMSDENQDQRQKILTLTKVEKVKLAIDFILKYTDLKY